MRAAYHLAIAVFSLGAVAAPSTAPNATSDAAELPARAGPQHETTLASHFSRGALVGETLPEDIELHPISKHETYRYAIVNSHRVIVDAASRRVVYVVR